MIQILVFQRRNPSQLVHPYMFQQDCHALRLNVLALGGDYRGLEGKTFYTSTNGEGVRLCSASASFQFTTYKRIKII